MVYAKPPFGGPEQVLAYLGRYTYRIAISNEPPNVAKDGCAPSNSSRLCLGPQALRSSDGPPEPNGQELGSYEVQDEPNGQEPGFYEVQESLHLSPPATLDRSRRRPPCAHTPH